MPFVLQSQSCSCFFIACRDAHFQEARSQRCESVLDQPIEQCCLFFHILQWNFHLNRAPIVTRRREQAHNGAITFLDQHRFSPLLDCCSPVIAHRFDMYGHFWFSALLNGTAAGHGRKKTAGSIGTPAA
jgi:hypothetical protein